MLINTQSGDKIVVKYNGPDKGFSDSGLSVSLSRYFNDKIVSDGEIVQIGSWVLKIVSLGNGEYELFEPVYSPAIPIEFVSGLDKTYEFMQIMNYVNESLSIGDEAITPLNHSCIICTDLFEADSFYLSRDEVEGNDTGWFFGCGEPEHDHSDPGNLMRESIYRVCCLKPELFQFINLPVGIEVVKRNNVLKVGYNQAVIDIKKNSYLDKKYQL